MVTLVFASWSGKASVVTDPFDSTIAGYTPLKLKSEIVTVSCDDLFIIMLKAVKGDPFLINEAW